MALEGKGTKEVGPNRHIPRHKDKLFYKPVLDIILGVCTLSFQSSMLEVSSFVLEVSSLEPNKFSSGQSPLIECTITFDYPKKYCMQIQIHQLFDSFSVAFLFQW